MNRSKTFLGLIVVCCFSFLSYDSLSAERTKDNSQPADVNIAFYGKVLDDSNKPVEGAYIYAHILCSDEKSGVKKFTVKTDPNGLFNIDTTGYALDIKTIRKDGFALEKGENILSFDGSSFSSEPVVFYLKKMGMPTMLHSIYSLAFMPPDNR